MLKKKLINNLWKVFRLLDQPGGRLILGKCATYLYKRQTYKDVEIFYDKGLWSHRAGSYYFPDGHQFNYTTSSSWGWKDQAKTYISNAEDFWFQHYRPKQGDVVIDIGAGQGEDVLSFSQGVGDTGRVIAFEAHPYTFKILKSFCRLNRLTNTTPLQIALMDKAGTVAVDESEVWQSNLVNLNSGSAGLVVRADTLDNICKAENVRDVDFLKMNIEGAERYALLGAESVIQRVRTICVACHDFRADYGEGEQFRTRDFVNQFLVDHGFKVTSRKEDPRDYIRDHLFGLR